MSIFVCILTSFCEKIYEAVGFLEQEYVYFKFYHILSKCFPEWLHQFAILEAVSESTKSTVYLHLCQDACENV